MTESLVETRDQVIAETRGERRPRPAVELPDVLQSETVEQRLLDEVQPDHVHLFVSCPPRDAPAAVMNVLKSLTARELFTAFRTQLQQTHWGGKLWADGYYVGSAGDHVTADLIKRYIEYQDREADGTDPLM
mgnify:CR=1 FL=1